MGENEGVSEVGSLVGNPVVGGLVGTEMGALVMGVGFNVGKLVSVG